MSKREIQIQLSNAVCTNPCHIAHHTEEGVLVEWWFLISLKKKNIKLDSNGFSFNNNLCRITQEEQPNKRQTVRNALEWSVEQGSMEKTVWMEQKAGFDQDQRKGWLHIEILERQNEYYDYATMWHRALITSLCT